MFRLRVVGEEYKKNFEQMIRKAYSVLFSKVDIGKALPSDVINTFIREYSMARSTASQAAKIFVFLAQKGDIPLSKEIIEELVVSEEKIKPVRAIKKHRKIEKGELTGEEEIIKEQLPEEAFGRFSLKGVGYVDIKDKDTFELAKAYFKVLAKKLGIAEEEASK
jgi:predicted transcriptional regulator